MVDDVFPKQPVPREGIRERPHSAMNSRPTRYLCGSATRPKPSLGTEPSNDRNGMVTGRRSRHPTESLLSHWLTGSNATNPDIRVPASSFWLSRLLSDNLGHYCQNQRLKIRTMSYTPKVSKRKRTLLGDIY